MALDAWLAGPYPSASRPRPRPRVEARYEAQDRDDENANHWTAATPTSPNSATNRDAREKIRNKVRHERENNGNLDAMIQQYAGDFIGTGPRLQLQDDTENSDTWTRPVERSFARWAAAVNLADKLTTLVETEPLDGESFLQFLQNPLVEGPVKLDLRNLEAEQIATPDLKTWLDTSKIDGIDQDQFGNVIAYHVLREHPGDFLKWGSAYDVVPAETICHWFRPQRAGQARGMSSFASSIETCGAIRRYAKAQLGKQELGAHIAASMEIDASLDPDAEDPDPIEVMDVIPIPRKGMITVPKGSNAKIFEPAQNTTGYGEYVDVSWTSVGRPLLIPRNLVTGDSSGFNFATGKMDHLPWQASIYRKRERLRHRVMSKVIRVWYAFALLAGEIPANAPPLSAWIYDLHYDGFPSIDEGKDADAAEKRMKLGLSNLSIECAALGYDWREIARQRAKERKFYQSLTLDPDLGLVKAPAPAAAAPKARPADDDTDPDDTRVEGKIVYV